MSRGISKKLRYVMIGSLCGVLLLPIWAWADNSEAGAPAEKPLVASASGTAPAVSKPAAESASVPGAAETVPAKPAAAGAPGATTAATALQFHANLYFGLTNINGPTARNTDGAWAGAGFALPSTLSLDWSHREDQAVHVAVGIGDLYTGRGTPLHEPVEAYYSFHGAGGEFTAGKFYVPFASQEWEYEPKYGLMYRQAHGRMDYTTSLQYDQGRRTPNAYLRVGRRVGPQSTLGVSVGLGRGLTYSTSHTMAYGLDFSQEWSGLQLSAEYDFVAGSSQPFQFVYGKLALTKLGNWQPFVGAYYWHDSTGELGHSSSALVGLGYRLTPQLGLETGYARANGRNVFWLQSHTQF